MYADKLGHQLHWGLGRAVIQAQLTVEVLHEVRILPLQCLISHPLPAPSSPSSSARAFVQGGFRDFQLDDRAQAVSARTIRSKGQSAMAGRNAKSVAVGE
jgi:hypothetical protein